MLDIRGPSNIGAQKGSLFHSCIEACLNEGNDQPYNYIEKGLAALKPNEKDLLTKEHHKEVRQWLINHQSIFVKHKKYEIVGTEIEFNLIYEKVGDKFYRIDNILGPEYYTNLPVENHFVIKGFIDLVLRDKNGTIHVIDWKTGQKKYSKTSDDLYTMWQPRMYYLAATELFPANDYEIVFDYIHAFRSPLHFGSGIKQEVLNDLYSMWCAIYNNNNPRRFNKENFHCKYLCGLGYYDGVCNDTYQKLKQGLIIV